MLLNRGHNALGTSSGGGGGGTTQSRIVDSNGNPVVDSNGNPVVKAA